jgi:putative membrane protein
MWIFWILLIIAVGVMVAAIVRSGRDTDAGRSPERTALDVLDDRYARGEIDRTEDERMRRDLGR